MKNTNINPNDDGFEIISSRGDIFTLRPIELFKIAVRFYNELAFEDALKLICAIQMNREDVPFEISERLNFLKGDIFLDTKEFNKACECYSEILSVKKCEIAFNNRALSQWELNQFDAALEDYLNAIELNPQNEISHRGAGEMYLAMGKPELAILQFEQALKLNEKYTHAFTGLGVAYLKIEKWAEAHQAFEQAISLDPADWLAKEWLSALDERLK